MEIIKKYFYAVFIMKYFALLIELVVIIIIGFPILIYP